ncbi:fumarylacetoacetate (FAA) hydrolase family protein [Sagittula marina]|uniref:Fumarylacetoacetate (FAA) hydrolase family protein n=1 Tax=Sagittula marina TaxID=943940 RepID=A0A7W6GSA6_9RHOB|nr:fumarylacetoacetate hydrolase family protein [Sagittula marina]MBB3985745.1 fumarylacetoacetate (FAA) hydrolase family protein [Sagittula marina]
MTLSMPDPNGTFLVRLWHEGHGPIIAVLRDNRLFDITSRATPTMSSLLERDDLLTFIAERKGTDLGPLDPLPDDLTLLAPCDLQVIKASGVTFAQSMVERVIEEQAAGDPDRAEAIRKKVTAVIGDSLAGVTPGSDKALQVKDVLQAEGLWSPYLEVGIGPDAEVFTKCPTLAAVGHGADVGLHPISRWNNPEPEIVLAVTSTGRIVGATLGNDVNLRDVEGRSALLLGKAKDNNASAAIGPFLRLFDDSYTMDDMQQAELTLTVTGQDGFTLNGRSSMSQISRTPASIVAQTIGAHHQYPDGFMLYLGTLFAPTQDRDAPGQGFTHKVGDVVSISEPSLGTLTNTVRLSTDCPPWQLGITALMANLAGRGLL